MNTNYDVIVLGLGAMGSATVYQLAKRGVNVLGIDRFSPPHKVGSTHGDTRITRQAIGEGGEYVPLALRSYEIWYEIEKETSKKLLTITGGLMLGTDDNDFIKTTIASAKKFNIAHRLLSTEEIRKEFPQFNVTTERGYYENNAGFLRPELCIEAQLELAKRYGAELRINEQVQQFTPITDGSVEVRTDKGIYKAKKLIVSAGPWVGELFPEYKEIFKVYRQVMYWFDIKGDINRYAPENFPIFIWESATHHDTYGFPAVDGEHGGLKIGFEDYEIDTTPEKVDRSIDEKEAQRMYNVYVKDSFLELSHKVVKAVSCLYTVTPDSGFVIDTHPEHNQIIIASPCSGHGFKHSAAIGETLAELALEGKTTIDISKFKIDRFKK